LVPDFEIWDKGGLARYQQTGDSYYLGVPHLRDGFIVGKVGNRAKRDRLNVGHLSVLNLIANLESIRL